MNSSSSQIIFKQLLDRHESIQIPMIQRDFAQGRRAEKEVRTDFLNALHGAFLLDPSDESLPLNLDFIYGSVEEGAQTRFFPLDGQQRLTTLFLLHWYLALKDGCLEEFRRIFCSPRGSRFSYSVRPSSEEFFNALVSFSPATVPGKDNSLLELIVNQPWYFRYWRLDPTIQSALIMLESIHRLFAGTQASFSRMLDTERPVITFQLLDLANFGLSDDLYIKMNARGKPLTVFETFKARYEQLLEAQFEGETRVLAGQTVPVTEYFARQMDTCWADFFWSYRDTETNLFDTAVMNLFHAVAMVSRDPGSTSYLSDIVVLKEKGRRFSYHALQSRGWLDRGFSEDLFMLLDTWSQQGAVFKQQLPGKQFFDESAFFDLAVSEPASIGYTELVQFAGYVLFLREHAQASAEVFQEWMRVVCNLSVNSSYERPADMQRSIVALLKLVSHGDDILEHFASEERPTVGFNTQQVAEEVLKAQLIQAHAAWRPLIDKAEGHSYFKGQIEFLLNFCGAVDKAQDSPVQQWSASIHSRMQTRFRRYLKQAETMFNVRGLASLDDYRWERALLSLGDYLLPSGQNWSFLVNSSAEQGSWKRLLRGANEDAPMARQLLQTLWDQLGDDAPLEQQLDALIACASELDSWRQALIETPKAFEYCRLRSLRWMPEGDVYLLTKSRMSGTHAELYSYALYHRLAKASVGKKLLPLQLGDYESVSGSEIEPHFTLGLEQAERRLDIVVFSDSGEFRINIDQDSASDFPELEQVLIAQFSFLSLNEHLTVSVARDDVEKTLRRLADLLNTYNE